MEYVSATWVLQTRFRSGSWVIYRVRGPVRRVSEVLARVQAHPRVIEVRPVEWFWVLPPVISPRKWESLIMAQVELERTGRVS